VGEPPEEVMIVDGAGDVIISSLTDSVSASIAGMAWAWYAQDAGTLDVACQADDHVTPEAQSDDATGRVDVISIQWIPT
jgi:bifunctional ADP-heptose synthase (sugar kinase/adenylyltransferase)